MGSTRSRQGSAALSHVQGRASRLALATAAALLLVLLAAAPAMAGTASVEGTTLFYRATAGDVNNVTITDQGGGSYMISDTAPITAGNGCVPDGEVVTCSGTPPIDTLWINVGAGNDSVRVVASAPSRVFGRDGDDTIDVVNGVRDRVECGDGSDSVTSDQIDSVAKPECEINDDLVAPITTVFAGPLGEPGNRNPHFDFRADEHPNVTYVCSVQPIVDIQPAPTGITDDGAGFVQVNTVNPHRFSTGDTVVVTDSDPSANGQATITVIDEDSVVLNDKLYSSDAGGGDIALAPADERPCESGEPLTDANIPLSDGDWVFKVRARDDLYDESYGRGIRFAVETTAPVLTVSGPASPIATSTPTFTLTADEQVRFECSLDGGSFSVCGATYTTVPLADGDHSLTVRATDLARNSTEKPVGFRIDVPGNEGGDGGGTPPTLAPSRIIIDSLVLISGAGVKMSRRGIVGIRLTCAGSKRCKGRMRITTAEPVSRKSRKLVTLGSKRFSIGANKKRKVKVRFSKSKRRLAKRLKRFKAKVVITEVDQRGNPRISSRVFILRAR